MFEDLVEQGQQSVSVRTGLDAIVVMVSQRHNNPTSKSLKLSLLYQVSNDGSLAMVP